jgi:ABC-type phosphonate transport system ATPase subunit
MISDTLDEALIDINDYLQQYPQSYGELAAELSVVTTLMDSLSGILWLSPGGVDDVLADKLREAIRSLDLSRVVEARDAVFARTASRRLMVRPSGAALWDASEAAR